jgi:hypothetical protein
MQPVATPRAGVFTLLLLLLLLPLPLLHLLLQGRNTSTIPEADVPEVCSAAAHSAELHTPGGYFCISSSHALYIMQACVFAKPSLCCRLNNSNNGAITRNCRQYLS